MAQAKFKLCKNDSDLKEVYRYDADAFAETSDFEWTIASLKKTQEQGWDIFSVSLDQEIIAACFTKITGKSLHSKNTAIKLSFQGMGISHQIKEFFEDYAKKNKLTSIINYCAVDNFRNIALNESHGYIKLPAEKNSEVIQWKKKVG
jgi:RimJ/RimL family protein N-acetyltransferase